MAQVNYKNYSNKPSCIAIYSSKMGYENPKTQKEDLQKYSETAGLKIDNYVDSAGHDGLSTEQVSDRFSRTQQPVVLIWRLDCLPLAIKSLEDLFKLLSTLGKKNITLISVVDMIDTDLSAHKFSITLYSAWKAFKKNRKITNARATSAKVKSKGIVVKTGRKKQRDDSIIHSLRRSGLTIREIAAQVQLSTTAVQRSLKTLNEDTDLQKNMLY